MIKRNTKILCNVLIASMISNAAYANPIMDENTNEISSKNDAAMANNDVNEIKLTDETDNTINVTNVTSDSEAKVNQIESGENIENNIEEESEFKISKAEKINVKQNTDDYEVAKGQALSSDECSDIPTYNPIRLMMFALYEEQQGSSIKYSSDYAYEKLENQNMKEAYNAIVEYLDDVYNGYDNEDSVKKGDLYCMCKVDLYRFDLNKSQLDQLFISIKADNPQYFWLNNTRYNYEYDNNGIITSFIPCTLYQYRTKSQRVEMKNKLENAIEKFLGEINGSSDYEKELQIADKICGETIYDYNVAENSDKKYDSRNDHNIAGVLIDHIAVCEGYAKTMQILLNAENIPCIFVAGTGNGGNHAWNIVKLDGQYYNVDATWMDKQYGKSYKWFNVSDDDFKNHIANSPSGNTGSREFLYELPKCNGTEYSYENQNPGYVLTSYADNDIKQYVKDRIMSTIENDENIVRFHINNEDKVKEVFNYILSNINNIINEDNELYNAFIGKYENYKNFYYTDSEVAIVLDPIGEDKIESVLLPDDEITFDSLCSDYYVIPEILPANAVNYDYYNEKPKWSSSDEKVAKVVDGQIKPVGNGTAEISVNVGGFECKKPITVHVKGIVEKVTINTPEDITEKGGIEKLTAQINPDNATDKTVSWTIVNDEGKKIAAINQNTGELQPIQNIYDENYGKNGQVIVRATANDGSGQYDEAVVNISGQNGQSNPEKKVSSIEITGNDISESGKKEQLTAKVYPEDASNKKLKWTIEKGRDCANIDEETGEITPIKDGEITVRAAAVDGSNVYKEKVIKISGQNGIIVKVSKIEITGNDITEKGKKEQLSAKIEPENATNKNLEWTIVEGEEFASIDEKTGEVTPIKDGEITVRAAALDGSNVYGEKNIKISGQGDKKIIDGTFIQDYITYDLYQDKDSNYYYKVKECARDNTNTNIEILSTITKDNKSIPVTEIGASAFRMCNNITKINVPDSVKKVDSLAFSSCKNLKTICFGSGVEDINYSAISRNYNLENIEVSKDNKKYQSIDGVLFDKNDSGRLLRFPDNNKEFKFNNNSITCIGSGAFYTNISWNELLQNDGSIKLPDSVKIIEDNAFAYAKTNINKKYIGIRVPENIESIGCKIFNHASSSCILAESDTQRDKINNILKNNENYAEVNEKKDIPQVIKLKVNNKDSYKINKDNKQIIFDLKGTDIQVDTDDIENTFIDLEVDDDSYFSNIDYSDDWKSVTLTPKENVKGNSTVYLYVSRDWQGSNGIFRSYDIVKKINIDIDTTNESDDEYVDDSEGLEYKLCSDENGNEYYEVCDYKYTQEGDKLTKVIVPETYKGIPVKSIELHKLDDEENADSLKHLAQCELPDSVVNIGPWCFMGAKKLKKVIMPAVENIDGEAFYECEQLKEITLPETLQKLDEYAFFKCSSLEKINIPCNLDKVEFNVFANCSNLKDIYSNNINYVIENDALIYKDEDGSKSLICFINKNNSEEYKINDDISVIIPSAFSEHKEIRKVTVGKDVTVIYEEAFDGCENLEEVEFNGENVTEIWSHAFSDCKKLKTIKIPGKVEAIGVLCFENDNELEKVELSPNISKIYDSTFEDCTKLTECIIPDNVAKIGEKAFNNCSSLKIINIPDKASEIATTAFRGCNNAIFIVPDEDKKDFLIAKNIVTDESRIKIVGLELQGESNNIDSNKGSVTYIAKNETGGDCIIESAAIEEEDNQGTVKIDKTDSEIKISGLKNGKAKVKVIVKAMVDGQEYKISKTLNLKVSNQSEVTEPLDKTLLENKIKEAEKVLESVQVSEDGSDIKEAENWIKQEEKDKLNAAIKNAVDAEKAAVTMDDINKGIETLESAINEFKKSVSKGNKKPLDKTPLENKIKEAEKVLESVPVSEDGSDIKESDNWIKQEEKDKLNNAIKNAVDAEKAAVTMDDINKGIETLESAINEFKKSVSKGNKKPLDKTPLENKIKEAEKVLESVQVSEDGSDIEEAENWIKQEEKDKLNTAIENAAKAKEAAVTMDDITKEIETLESAIDEFKKNISKGNKKPLDKTPLENEIKKARKVLESVQVSKDGSDIKESDNWIKQECKDELNDAIENAVKAKETAVTMDDINKGIETLESAIDEFKKSISKGNKKPLDKTPLENEIKKARKVLESVQVSKDGSDIKESDNWIKQEEKDKLNAAIKNAVDAEKAAVTMDDINKDIEDLEAAIDKFNQNISKGNKKKEADNNTENELPKDPVWDNKQEVSKTQSTSHSKTKEYKYIKKNPEVMRINNKKVKGIILSKEQYASEVIGNSSAVLEINIDDVSSLYEVSEPDFNGAVTDIKITSNENQYQDYIYINCKQTNISKINVNVETLKRDVSLYCYELKADGKFELNKTEEVDKLKNADYFMDINVKPLAQYIITDKQLSKSSSEKRIINSGWSKFGNSWRYMLPDGSYAKGWIKDKNIWYMLDDKNNTMKTGWVKDNNKWYFLDKASGAMKTGWIKDDNKWYFLDKVSGAMSTGWLHYNGEWYYLNADGSMAKDTTVNGYKIGNDGTLI